MFQLRRVDFVLHSALPINPHKTRRRNHVRSFKLDTMAFAVHVFELAYYRSEDPAFPRFDLFLVISAKEGDGVKV